MEEQKTNWLSILTATGALGSFLVMSIVAVNGCIADFATKEDLNKVEKKIDTVSEQLTTLTQGLLFDKKANQLNKKK